MKRWFIVLLCILGTAGAAYAKPLSQEQFTARFVKLLKAAQPDVAVKIEGPADLTVKPAKGGGEFHVFLGNAYMQYLNDPKQLEAILKLYLSQTVAIASAKVQSDKLDRKRIVPIVRDQGWIDEMRRNVQDKTGKDAFQNIYEEFCPGLVVVYAEDTGEALRYFTQKQLDEAGLQKSELRELAVANLRRIVPKYKIKRLLAVSRVEAAQGYDASFLLFTDLWEKLAGKHGDLVVAIPTREVLLFTPVSDREGMKMIGPYATKLRESFAYALTDRLYIYHEGRFETLN